MSKVLKEHEDAQGKTPGHKKHGHDGNNAQNKATETFRVTIEGKVQGVGFRPAVYRVAEKLQLKGRIANSPSGALLEIEGIRGFIKPFIAEVRRSLPPQAHIASVHLQRIKRKNFDTLVIAESVQAENVPKENVPAENLRTENIQAENAPQQRIQKPHPPKENPRHKHGRREPREHKGPGKPREPREPREHKEHKEHREPKEQKEPLPLSAETPPDLSICPECLQEVSTPGNRRYRYPFINCTNCGPRFTIIRELPYDRPKTTMASFAMCPECTREYTDPGDRRFHAQPDACPACGPHIELITNEGSPVAKNDEALKKTVEALRGGKIVALKSLGGYHLACDATNADALAALRRRKDRPHKPFALMLPDVESVKRICHVGPKEEELLLSAAHPIVLLRKLAGGEPLLASELIAPNNAYLGVMLPYTPLHCLLFDKTEQPGLGGFPALVMTSGNRQDEPICKTETEAREKLSRIADLFLVNDRPIHNRCDDSIVQVLPNDDRTPVQIRRSRGYVPDAVHLQLYGTRHPAVLGTGAELKNTFCLTRGANAYVSQYIGELDNQEALVFYKEALALFKRFLAVEPTIVAHDLHPNYLSTAFARELAAANKRVTLVPVQHHYAHVASVMAEARLDKPVIGFAFDGLGYGLDGNIWGGECVWLYESHVERLAHFEYFPLPGGDVATKEIWRLAVSLLRKAGITELPERIAKDHPHAEIRTMIEKRLNTPLCCSVGRIFDAVSAIIGLRDTVTFEAQAAIELESIALDIDAVKGYNFDIDPGETAVISLSKTVQEIWQDVKAGVPQAVISAQFHRTIADIVLALSERFRKKLNVDDIVLSGGVFQNRLLLTLIEKRLKAAGFAVHYNRLVPANDGGISLGQAWMAMKSSIRR